MHAGQVNDDVEAVIMAAEEHPEYRDQIIDGFIDQVMRRRRRRLTFWRTTALLLVVGALGTLFIDRLISFPLSLFALIFLWIVIVGVWASYRIIAVIVHHAVRFALMWLVTRMALRRSVSSGIFSLITISVAKESIKRLISAL
jgi:hypothetical protein